MAIFVGGLGVHLVHVIDQFTGGVEHPYAVLALPARLRVHTLPRFSKLKGTVSCSQCFGWFIHIPTGAVSSGQYIGFRIHLLTRAVLCGQCIGRHIHILLPSF
jgi:hypothetical protein